MYHPSIAISSRLRHYPFRPATSDALDFSIGRDPPVRPLAMTFSVAPSCSRPAKQHEPYYTSPYWIPGLSVIVRNSPEYDLSHSISHVRVPHVSLFSNFDGARGMETARDWSSPGFISCRTTARLRWGGYSRLVASTMTNNCLGIIQIQIQTQNINHTASTLGGYSM